MHDKAEAPRVNEAQATEPAQPDGEGDVARTAGRGGLAISFAKAYFMVTGLVQQIALPRALGLDGYGALSSALSIASLTYNPVITTSIQGVSRAVTQASPDERPAALRKALSIHGVFALLLGAGFCLIAPLVARIMGAPHIITALHILSAILLLYGLYTPLVGALNGQRRFLHQAALDIVAATLRTVGLIAGAFWFARQAGSLSGVDGASLGFVASTTIVLALALAFVGLGRSGTTALTVKSYVLFALPILAGQALLNVLLQADLTLLRAFASRAAERAGLPLTAADPLVGAYRATQLFSFLPYQLLLSFTFVLFPMLSLAIRDDDRPAIRTYVRTGLRLALIIAGLMVSVTSGLSGNLLHLVFGAEAAHYGDRSLELLSLGFGAFAILGILTTVLNSLKHELQSALLTLVAAVLVIVLCFWRVRGQPFGEDLLFRTAVATSSGLALATALAAWLVYRAVGSLVAPVTLVRVLVALGAGVAVGRFLPYSGKVLTVAQAALVVVVYLVALIVTRELGKDDLTLVARVIRRRKPQP